MSEFQLGFEKIAPVTWVYLSSLLMLALYFKFSRTWSVRNLDLILLILLAPGLICVQRGQELQREIHGSAPHTREAPRSDSTKPQAVAPELTQLIAHYEELPITSETVGADSSITDAIDPLALAVDDERPLAADDEAAGGRMAGSIAVAIPKKSPEEQRAINMEYFGFLWLFAVGAVILVRMLLDPMMVRRPLLEPNLSLGGLTFIGCALLVFLMANVISGSPDPDDLKGPAGADKLLARKSGDSGDDLSRQGPGYPLLHVVPRIVTTLWIDNQKDAAQTARAEQDERTQMAYVVTAKTMAVLGHLAVVIGIVFIGYRHFDNLKMGIGTATLYLMLPYTAEMTGRVYHVLPAALLVWAVASYRRPWTSGMFLGLAIGVFYYPLFLLPLWLSFYWQRGLMRFMVGVVTSVALVVLSLVFTSDSVGMFWDQLRQLFGVWLPKMEFLEGVWGLGWDPVYRLPILAAFFALGGSFALWPAQKNLGTLLGCSAAVMLATQFWHGFGGGLFMAWYLPLVLLTVFRPNLEDRVALTVLGEGWFPRRLKQVALFKQAA